MKGADQLDGTCAADVHLYFCICLKQVVSSCGSNRMHLFLHSQYAHTFVFNLIEYVISDCSLQNFILQTKINGKQNPLDIKSRKQRMLYYNCKLLIDLSVNKT